MPGFDEYVEAQNTAKVLVVVLPDNFASIAQSSTMDELKEQATSIGNVVDLADTLSANLLNLKTALAKSPTQRAVAEELWPMVSRLQAKISDIEGAFKTQIDPKKFAAKFDSDIKASANSINGLPDMAATLSFPDDETRTRRHDRVTRRAARLKSALAEAGTEVGAEVWSNLAELAESLAEAAARLRDGADDSEKTDEAEGLKQATAQLSELLARLSAAASGDPETYNETAKQKAAEAQDLAKTIVATFAKFDEKVLQRKSFR